MCEEKMLSINEAMAARKVVGRYLIEAKGEIEEDERCLLGRILLEAQFTIEHSNDLNGGG
jgi:hypothetical protein